MKQSRIILGVLVAGVLFFGLCGTAAAVAPVNMGFETGDLTGWTGNGSIVTSHASYSPVEGSYFAKLTSGSEGSYVSIYQDFSIVSGGTISGWAAFDTTDYLPYNDDAVVLIKDDSGSTIATPWSANVALVGNYGNTPWQEWSWTAPADGEYTLFYGVRNIGDSGVDSYGLFDAGQFSEPESGGDTIPEPMTMALFGSGLVGLAGLRKRK